LFITISTNKKAVGHLGQWGIINTDENFVKTAASSLAAQSSLPTLLFGRSQEAEGCNINLCLNKIHNTVNAKV